MAGPDAKPNWSITAFLISLPAADAQLTSKVIEFKQLLDAQAQTDRFQNYPGGKSKPIGAYVNGSGQTFYSDYRLKIKMTQQRNFLGITKNHSELLSAD